MYLLTPNTEFGILYQGQLHLKKFISVYWLSISHFTEVQLRKKKSFIPNKTQDFPWDRNGESRCQDLNEYNNILNDNIRHVFHRDKS